MVLYTPQAIVTRVLPLVRSSPTALAFLPAAVISLVRRLATVGFVRWMASAGWFLMKRSPGALLLGLLWYALTGREGSGEELIAKAAEFGLDKAIGVSPSTLAAIIKRMKPSISDADANTLASWLSTGTAETPTATQAVPGSIAKPALTTTGSFQGDLAAINAAQKGGMPQSAPSGDDAGALRYEELKRVYKRLVRVFGPDPIAVSNDLNTWAGASEQLRETIRRQGT
jgi:hypothetical protein